MDLGELLFPRFKGRQQSLQVGAGITRWFQECNQPSATVVKLRRSADLLGTGIPASAVVLPQCPRTDSR